MKALQCLLKEKSLYAGRITGVYSKATIAAAKAWQDKVGLPVKTNWTRANWMSLLAAGATPVLKFGSAGTPVRRLQRALNAVSGKTQLNVSGVFDRSTDTALRTYQRQVKVAVTGVLAGSTLRRAAAGKR